MHPSVERLYEAAKSIGVTAEPSAVADWLNESPQVINNWKNRGVSKQGAIAAQKKTGFSAAWILDGTGDRMASSAGAAPPAAPGRNFDELDSTDRRVLENLNVIKLDPVQLEEVVEFIANKAARLRAVQQVIEDRLKAQYGIKAPPAKHAADAKKTEIARAALNVTEQLRQGSLLDDEDKKP